MIKLRPITELDIEAVTEIDEKITGKYKPDDWERRFGYYLRRDPELSLIAEEDGRVVGFMLGEVRAGEFGLEEPAGWIEVMGVDPECQGRSVGRELLNGMLTNFRTRKATAVRTLVNEQSQAQLLAFFEQSDFQPTPLKTLEHKL
jgi:ribosomal protein S18 acetylase RimI-like enzyme